MRGRPRSATVRVVEPAPRNPYSAPAADGPAVAGGVPSLDYFEENGNLVVRDGALLPPICVATGEPVDGPPAPRKVHVYPKWTIFFVAILLSPAIAFILALVLRKTYSVSFRVNTSAVAKRRNAIIIGLAILVGGVGAGVGLVMADVPYGGFFGFVAFWVGLLWALLKDRPYVAREAAGEYVYLRLCGSALYEFEQYKERAAPAAPVVAAATNPNSPF